MPIIIAREGALPNAFVQIDGWMRAQALADSISPAALHRLLDDYAALCCPVLDVFQQTYHNRNRGRGGHGTPRRRH